MEEIRISGRNLCNLNTPARFGCKSPGLLPEKRVRVCVRVCVCARVYERWARVVRVGAGSW